MIRFASIAVVAVALMGVAGCNTLSQRMGFGSDRTQTTAAMLGVIEPITAAAFGNDTAVFWVSSNGCTTKADLQPVIDRIGDQSRITLRRLTEDRCTDEGVDAIELRWSFEELGLAGGSKVSANNPYQLPPS